MELVGASVLRASWKGKIGNIASIISEITADWRVWLHLVSRLYGQCGRTRPYHRGFRKIECCRCWCSFGEGAEESRNAEIAQTSLAHFEQVSLQGNKIYKNSMLSWLLDSCLHKQTIHSAHAVFPISDSFFLLFLTPFWWLQWRELIWTGAQRP